MIKNHTLKQELNFKQNKKKQELNLKVICGMK